MNAGSNEHTLPRRSRWRFELGDSAFFFFFVSLCFLALSVALLNRETVRKRDQNICDHHDIISTYIRSLLGTSGDSH